jgi:ribonuclease PH
MNIVMTESGKFVELQGTAESAPFSTETLVKMLGLGKKGVLELVEMQKAALEEAGLVG